MCSLFGSVSLLQDRGAVVVREGLLNRLGVVLKIEHKDIVLLGMRSIQADSVCTAFDARQRLVDVHRVQKRLVVAGLKLVRADQESIWIFLN